MRSLLSGHSSDIWVDTVRGVGCIDHFTRQRELVSSYTPPYYKVCLGGDNKWLTTLNMTADGTQRQEKIEAETRAEMVYNILCSVYGSAPTFDKFVKWYCYPSQSITMTTLAGGLELQRQLLPLQNHVDRQLFNARVQCVLEVLCSSSNQICSSIINIRDDIFPCPNNYFQTSSIFLECWLFSNLRFKHHHPGNNNENGSLKQKDFFRPLDFCLDKQIRFSTLSLIVNQYLASCRLLHNFSILNHFQGVFAPRSDLEGLKPYSCVARQAVRRLVSLGFNLDNLKNSFRADPNYEIPANVFLQDMTQVSNHLREASVLTRYFVSGSATEGSCSNRLCEKIHQRIFQSELSEVLNIEFDYRASIFVVVTVVFGCFVFFFTSKAFFNQL